MQRDLAAALDGGVIITSNLSPTAGYHKYTDAVCTTASQEVSGTVTGNILIADDTNALKLFQATSTDGALTYNECGANCNSPGNVKTPADAAEAYEFALAACNKIAGCASVSCTGASGVCKAQQSGCGVAKDGSGATDILFTRKSATLAVTGSNTLDNHYIQHTGATCDTGDASADSGKGAAIDWDDDASGANEVSTQAEITSGEFVFTPAISASSGTAATVSELCAAACDQHDSCKYFEMVGTDKASWNCKPYSTCAVTPDGTTATNLVFNKDSGAVLSPADSSDEWIVNHNFKCASPTAPTTKTSTDLSWDGTDYKVTVDNTASDVFKFKDAAGTLDVDLTNANQQGLCTAACASRGGECIGVVMTGVDVMTDLTCTPFSACAGSGIEVEATITGTTAVAVKGRSIAASTGAAAYTEDTGATCAGSTFATDASGIELTYDTVVYKVDSTSGVISLKIGTTDKALSAITYNSGKSLQGLCAAACDVITDCHIVAVVTTTSSEACKAYPKNGCVLTHNADAKLVVLTNQAAETDSPTDAPTLGPTAGPSKEPTKGPSAGPSKGPSKGPSGAPSKGPSAGPSSGPSVTPSAPTPGPTHGPSKGPAVPTVSPSGPTSDPTPAPSKPTENPTVAPSKPTPFPSRPTNAPIVDPTPAPSQPTPAPTRPTPAPTQPTPAPVKVQTADVETTSASSTIMALQVVVFLAWALF